LRLLQSTLGANASVWRETGDMPALDLLALEELLALQAPSAQRSLRLLPAQALSEGITLLTSDARLAQYRGPVCKV
jgi:hypothetical protein